MIWALALGTLFTACNEADPQVYEVVDQAPDFPGGKQELFSYMARETLYPEQARKLGVEGKVYVQFVVDAKGNVTDAVVKKGIGAGCDAVALQVVQNMPRWEPGMLKGDAVATKMVLPISFQLQSDEEQVSQGADGVFDVVENPPAYPGGEKALYSYLSEEMKYPESSRQQGVEGRVYVQFIVDSYGDVTEAKVVKGEHEALNAEALRVVQNMPAWQPGTQAGTPVKVKMVMPVTFKL